MPASGSGLRNGRSGPGVSRGRRFPRPLLLFPTHQPGTGLAVSFLAFKNTHAYVARDRHGQARWQADLCIFQRILTEAQGNCLSSPHPLLTFSSL